MSGASTSASMSGISVEPGLPKTWVIPSSRRMSMRTSRARRVICHILHRCAEPEFPPPPCVGVRLSGSGDQPGDNDRHAGNERRDKQSVAQPLARRAGALLRLAINLDRGAEEIDDPDLRNSELCVEPKLDAVEPTLRRRLRTFENFAHRSSPRRKFTSGRSCGQPYAPTAFLRRAGRGQTALLFVTPLRANGKPVLA